MTHSEPLFTHDTYTRLATGYAPLYDDRPNHSSSPLIEATWLEYAAGDGAIVSTPSDMAAYLRMLLNRGSTPTGRIISEDSFRLLTQHASQESEGMWYGYGMSSWTVDSHNYIGHAGGMVGYSSQLRGDMDDNSSWLLKMTSCCCCAMARKLRWSRMAKSCSCFRSRSSRYFHCDFIVTTVKSPNCLMVATGTLAKSIRVRANSKFPRSGRAILATIAPIMPGLTTFVSSFGKTSWC